MNKTSVNESVKKGTVAGYRAEVRKTNSRRRNPRYVWAVCRIKRDEGFIFGKEYRVEVLPSGGVFVRDENGEATICDAKDFAFA